MSTTARRSPSPLLPLGASLILLAACPPADDAHTPTSATEASSATSTSTTHTPPTGTTSTTSTTTTRPSPATETSTAQTSTSTATTASDTTAIDTTTTAATDTDADTDADTCGDGGLDPGEECDLGSDNDNMGECTKLCQLPQCGDGLQQPGEACDLGPANHPSKYGGCTPECTLGPHCGDGHTDAPDEACDPEDPKLADPAACDACQWTAKLVFVSSTTHTGKIGGLANADTICQALASAAGLTSKGQAFRAWLSDSNKTAAERIAHSVAPYILVNGTKVADTWTDLVDGSLDHAIDLDEHGAAPINFHYVWTGTAWNGAVKKPGLLCDDWTDPPSDAKGTLGLSLAMNVEWTEAISFGEALCSKEYRLYCVQQ